MAKKKVNPLDIVAAAAKKKPAKKSKSATPIIEVKDPQVIAALKGWKDAKEREKDAASERKMLEEVMLPFGTKARRDLIQQEGKHLTAVKLKADEAQVTMKTSKAYSAIPTDNEDELTEIFGDDFDRYFQTTTAITFKAGATNNSEILQKIVDAVGADQFSEIFDVEQVIKVTDALVVDRDMNQECAEKHDQAVKEGLVKPYKPAFAL